MTNCAFLVVLVLSVYGNRRRAPRSTISSAGGDLCPRAPVCRLAIQGVPGRCSANGDGCAGAVGAHPDARVLQRPGLVRLRHRGRAWPADQMDVRCRDGAPLAYGPACRLYARRRVRPLRPVLGALAIALVIAGPWYASNLLHLGRDLLANAYAAGAREGDPALVSFESLIWYPTRLVQEHLYVVPTLLFLGGLLRWNRRNLYPLLLVVGPSPGSPFSRTRTPATSCQRWSASRSSRHPGSHAAAGSGPALLAYAAVAFEAISFGNPLLPAEVDVGPTSPSPSTATSSELQPTKTGISRPRSPRSRLDGRAGPSATRGSTTIWCNPWDVRYYAAKYGLTYVDSNADATVTRGDKGSYSRTGTRLAIVPRP